MLVTLLARCRGHVLVEVFRRGDANKIIFVDLAGSERLAKTGARGGRKKEGITINLGLLVLGKVIHMLSEGKEHVENGNVGVFRESNLTRLLKESFLGNTRTVFIGCVNQEEKHAHETISTLRYISRAGTIKTKVGKVESEEERLLRENRAVAVDARRLARIVVELGGEKDELVRKYLK